MFSPPRPPRNAALYRAVWSRRTLPFFLARTARRYGDLVHLGGTQPRFLLSHPELVHQTLVANAQAWAKGRGLEKTKSVLGEGVLSSEGELHRQRRRLLQPLFAQSRLHVYAETILDCAHATRASWCDGQVVDMSAAMSHLALDTVTRSVFGATLRDDANRIGAALDESMRLFALWMTPAGDLLERLPAIRRRREHVRAELDGVVYRLIEARRREGAGGDDVLSVLLRAHDERDEPLSDEAMRDEAMTLLLAGHETTANALCFAWFFLARHPQAKDELDRELKGVLNGRRATYDDLDALRWTRAVLCEAMRLLPPAWIVGRRALEDVPLRWEGHTFVMPRGATALISPFVLHRDPRFWRAPLRFDPARWLAPGFAPTKWSYLPFGAGARSCLAEGLAWMEATLALATLAQGFRATLCGSLELEPSVTLRPRGPLWMKVERAKRE